MPICKPAKKPCLLGDTDQPEEEFYTDFLTPTGKHIRRKTRWCRTCRENQRKYKNPGCIRKGIGVASRGGSVKPVSQLEPGNKPEMSKHHRRIHRLWLLSLITEQGRPKYPAALAAINQMTERND